MLSLSLSWIHWIRIHDRQERPKFNQILNSLSLIQSSEVDSEYRNGIHEISLSNWNWRQMGALELALK